MRLDYHIRWQNSYPWDIYFENEKEVKGILEYFKLIGSKLEIVEALESCLIEEVYDTCATTEEYDIIMEYIKIMGVEYEVHDPRRGDNNQE